MLHFLGHPVDMDINKPENQDKDALGKIEHLSYIY